MTRYDILWHAMTTFNGDDDSEINGILAIISYHIFDLVTTVHDGS